LNSIRSLVPVKDDSEDNLRAQLQEAQFKLKAAEEEIHRLQAQNPQQEEGSAASRCRIVERESNLCKSELRIVHSKVLSLHMLP
jgi:multidrug resistance efflux pump